MTTPATNLALPLPAFEAGAAADVLGTLVAVHFRDERGFAIFSLEQADGSRVRALGDLPADITLRAVVRLGGTWMRHAQHGWQIRVTTFELIDHLDRRGVVAFLVAYTKHLGPVRAAEAVKRFGDRVFEVLRETPEALCAIKGITPERARAIHASFGEVASIADIDSWLRHIGLGRADARRVREAYGHDAARLVRENPYRLADDIHGIGFLTADSLRQMLGIAQTSTFRLHAALKYVLSVVAHSEGHVYLPLTELVDRTARQLDERRASTGGWQPDPELVAAIRDYVPRFSESEDGYAEPVRAPADAAAETREIHVYARELYDAEYQAATHLTRLLREVRPLFEPDELASSMSQAETLHQIVLESDQRRAIATALTSQVSIISGGPGVGKTTSVRVLVALLEQRGVSYVLLSPTGKAAKRLAEATQRDAYTIHRQLFSLDRQRGQMRPRSGAEVYLPVDAVIVDEASMVDLPLLAWLLRSVKPGTRIIFVGDKDQLASIGPGSVLRDLIACGLIPVTLLTVIKRQGDGSPIVEAAHGINHGQLPMAGCNASGDLYILRARPPSEDQGLHAQQLVVECAVRLNAQVLTPQHTSSVGVTALNRALQARLNPTSPSKPEVQVANDVVFRLGDRLIVGKNNYQTLCFNGETGDIVAIGPEHLTLRMDDVDGERLVTYERDEWWQLQLAYAITTHRAQGSEWDHVVVVVSQSHYMMLQRNLLYTALTRARKRAVIVVSGGLENRQTGRIYKSALDVAVANDRIARRYSGLAERVSSLVTTDAQSPLIGCEPWPPSSAVPTRVVRGNPRRPTHEQATVGDAAEQRSIERLTR